MLSVVLVEPRFAGNVGSVARAMKNFGLRELVLVDPPVLGGEARALAAGAGDVLREARVTDVSALDGFDLLVGTSGVRAGGDRNPLRVPAHSPRELRELLKSVDGNVGLALGREDKGLYREELERCDVFVSIPTSEEYPVMNLSHAAAVLLYELRGLEHGGVEMAGGEELDALYRTVEDVVSSSRHPTHKRERSSSILKGVFGRAGLTARETHTLIGLIKDLGGRD
ncbi:MAG: tRNA (cytidine-2'-O-)-methyltransferase TrmJ [Methanonatronarchaeales archaeon]|nr:tRNA (cytidine-2'-O-)-methyltransferase TrmJ [Methanonatronarchaeales archaeon]